MGQAQLKIIDPAVFGDLKETMGMDMDDLIADFTEDTVFHLSTLREKMLYGNVHEILDTLKVLQAAGSEFGLQSFSKACKYIESDLEQGYIQDPEVMSVLDSEFEKVLEQLPSFRK
ncbi:MAG: hypothetical protein OEZ47_09775 [Gammaproteobacteria bacterium]|nr:hypothetical protein [Gammaproteobacteria bacterium]